MEARLQKTIRQLGLTCSIGIGPTRLLAKLACELDKPNGLTTLTADDVHGRLRALPVRRLSGIGPVSEDRLCGLGITTIGQLQDVSLDLLASAFPSGAAALKELAFGGRDETVRAGSGPPKSVSREVTFASDTDDRELLKATLLDLADRVAGDLRRQGYACRTLAAATSSTTVIYETAVALLYGLHPSGCRLRLLGLTLSGLTPEVHQLGLDDAWREAAQDEAVDRVRAKYGAEALRRAGAQLLDVTPQESGAHVLKDQFVEYH